MTIESPGQGTARPGKGSVVRVAVLTWLPTAVYIILIIAMAFLPSPRLPHIRHIDKYLHAAAYAVLAVLAYRAFIRSGSIRPILVTFLLGLSVGMADEGIQALGRMRRADRYDLMADLVGTAVGALVMSWYLRPEKPAAAGSTGIADGRPGGGRGCPRCG
jgi:VanZ family protein